MTLLAFLLPNWIGGHSALHSGGPQAGRIEGLWWLMFWVCTAVFVLVMAALAAALARRRAAESGLPGPIPPESHQRFRGSER